MSNGTVFLTSDAHLGAISPGRARSFMRWLEHAAARASEIVINGDLFDFWFEYRHAIPRGHTRILGALASVVDSGVPVRLVGGNHDWWGGSFLEDEIGLAFHRDPVRIDLAGYRTYLAHGDGLGRGDLGYRLLRTVLRGRLTRWGFRWLHPDVGAGVARLVSKTASGSEPGPLERGRAALLEEWALEKLRTEPDLDLVALGHTHVPGLLEVGDGRWYVNSGDWIYHRSYVVLDPDRPPRLLEWEGG